MGHQILISRGYPWADDAKHTKISNAEWDAFVSEEGDLEPELQAVGRNPKTGEEIRVNTPGGVKHKNGLRMSWGDGLIHAPYADELLDYYRYVAAKFSADIYDEEGGLL